MIPVNRPLITPEDREMVISALESTWISGETPPVREMESTLAKVVGVKNAVAISTGTSAIDLAIESLELTHSAEILVPTFTIISTVSHLLRNGFKVKYVDADPVTWSMDANQTLQEINSNTQLIVPVHIFGLPVDVDQFITVAKDFGVFILEDAAEALGVTYKGRHCGALGDASIFSFYANKIVTGGEGGALCTNDDFLAEKVRNLRNLNFSKTERFVSAGLGYNQRLNGMSAALINSQLLRLEKLVEIKIRNAQIYLENLRNHPWFTFAPTTTTYAKNNFWVFPILLNADCPYNASELQKLLNKNEIETRRFFCPLHLQPIMKNFEFELCGDMKISENLWQRGLYLPSGIGTSESEILEVCEVLWSIK